MFSHPIPPVLAPIRLLPSVVRSTAPPVVDGALALAPRTSEAATGKERGLGLLEVVPSGRIVELCGSACASVGALILSAVQARGEPVAWIAPRSAGLFPPDLAAAGLDLSALVVVHVPESDARAGPKAAELLLRTGALGAVLIDTTGTLAVPGASAPIGASSRGAARGSMLRAPTAAITAWQGRLLGILREHDARLVILTSGEASGESLGPLVSVRLALSCRRVERREGGHAFEISTRVTKDKSGVLAGYVPRPEVRRGPLGA
jgi:recombination protein RecA